MTNRKFIYLLMSSFYATLCFSQNNKIFGKITDYESNKPLSNAEIYLTNSKTGTVSTSNGTFELSIDTLKESTLVVSHIGYYLNKIKINNKTINTPLIIRLKKSLSNINEIVITGTGTKNKVRNSPILTTLYTKDIISQTSSTNIEELLSTISPSFDFSPNKMGSFMQLNGFGNDYIQILIDGKRLYGGLGGQSDLNRISPNMIDRIEIVNGASSSLYGSDAIAGVINIITKKSEKNIYFENNTIFGEYSRWQQFNQVCINKQKFHSTTSFSRKQRDGWQLNKYKIDNNRTKDPSDDKLVLTYENASNKFHDNQINQKVSYEITNNLKIYGQGSLYEKSILIPTKAKPYGYDFEDVSYSIGGTYNLRNAILYLDYDFDNFKYYKLYTRKYDVKFTDQNGDRIVTYRDGDRPLQTDQTRKSISLKGILPLGKRNRLSLGAIYELEQLEAPNRLIGEKSSAYTNSIYAQDEYNINSSLFITSGLRYVNHKEFGNTITPKISLMCKTKRWNIRGTYSNGYKTPTLKELYYRYEKSGMGSHYLYLGDPNLKPQYSNYYSGSITYSTNNITSSLSLYLNDIDNLIDYKIIETSPEDSALGVKITKINSNINKAQSKGIDFSFNAKLEIGVSLGIGYSYVDARNITDKVQLEGTSKHYGTINAGWIKKINKNIIKQNIYGRLQSERYYDDGNAPEYSIWKYTITYSRKISRNINLDLTLGINNLFDKVDNRVYYSHYSTLSPGRTFFAGININYQ